jgi:hypothetical protein
VAHKFLYPESCPTPASDPVTESIWLSNKL